MGRAAHQGPFHSQGHRAFPEAIRQTGTDIAQKGTETSLIEQFLYPKFGPGQMWEKIAARVQEMGGEIITNFNITSVEVKDGHVVAVSGQASDGNAAPFYGRLFLLHHIGARNWCRPWWMAAVACRRTCARLPEVWSTGTSSPWAAGGQAEGARARRHSRPARLRQLDLHPGARRAGRPAAGLQQLESVLVADRSKVWLGAEYFCYEGDELWTRSEESMAEAGRRRAGQDRHHRAPGRARPVVVRMAKTYPAYFGAYDRFQEIARLRRCDSETCTWLAATACTSTTTRTTRC